MDAAARDLLQRNLSRLREGDRAAARPVFDVLWPICLGLARALLRHDDDAKDAAQAAIVKVFAEVALFDSARPGVGWALALVTWECRTVRKQRQRRRQDSLDDAVDSGAVDTITLDTNLVAGLIRAADVARVVDAFVSLTDADQATLRAFLDGERHATPTLRKRRQRALDRLRALVVGPEPIPAAIEPLAGDPHER